MSLGDSLLEELERTHRKMYEAQIMMTLFGSLFPFRVKGCLSRKSLRCFGIFIEKIHHKKIISEYEKLSSELAQTMPAQKTPSETNFKLVLEKYTDMIPRTSFWIGPHCVDFFFPQYHSRATPFGQKTQRFQGLVFEIDGSIHDQEPKMKKDEQKANALRDLGIYVQSVDNRTVNYQFVANTFYRLGVAQHNDTRSVRRLLCRLGMLTIFTWRPFKKIDEILGLKPGTTEGLLNNELKPRLETLTSTRCQK